MMIPVSAADDLIFRIAHTRATTDPEVAFHRVTTVASETVNNDRVPVDHTTPA